MNDCRNCQFLLRETESWEMPHIAWWTCQRKPVYENLTSFPFKRTKCKEFHPKVDTSNAAAMQDLLGEEATK